MIKAERQDKISDLIENQGTLSVREISDALAVSEMTIRRDLEELAIRGALVRVHGGARSVGTREGSMLRREYSHIEKRSRNAAEKLEIARSAVGLIEDDMTVFLGTGTTIEQMVPLLPSSRLRIITNSLSVFNLLESRDDYELCLVGGMYRARTAAFVGPMAEEAIDALGTDIAFIGANGVLGIEVSTSNMEEGKFQRLAFNKADCKVLAADSSKFGRRDFYTFYSLNDLDVLVCEPTVSDDAVAELSEHTRVVR